MRGALVVLCLLNMVNCNLGEKSESETFKKSTRLYGNVYAENLIINAIQGVVEELVSVTLEGKQVVLVLERDADIASFLSDNLTKTLRKPLSLLRLPQKFTHSKVLNTTLEGIDEPVIPISTQSVFVMVITSKTGGGNWWPLWNPLEDWKATSVILISSKPSCLSEGFLESPLLSRTPSVALLCPIDPFRKLPSNGVSFRIWSWKPYVEENPLVVIGTWNITSFKSWDQLFVDRFQDMTNKTLAILAAPVSVPYFYTFDDGQPHGVTYELMKTLSKKNRFDLNMTMKRVHWMEMYDGVREGKLDIFINYATLTLEKKRDYYLTVPYHQEGYGIMMSIPPPLPKWENILYPFAFSSWIAVIAAVTCTSLTYHVLNFEHEKSFASNTITVMQCLLSNPMENISKWWRIRSFLLAWWITSWFLHMSYTSNLIAVLTIPVFPKRIQTAQELLDSKNRLCLMDYGDFLPHALIKSSDPVLLGLGRKQDVVPLDFNLAFDGLIACVDRVVAGTHAHVEGFSFIDYLYYHAGHRSQVYLLKEQLYPSYLSLLVHKYAPWGYKIDEGIQSLVEGGLIVKWIENEMAEVRKRFKQKEQPKTEQPLSLDHLQGSFYLFLGGICLSLLAMSVEYITPAIVISQNIATSHPVVVEDHQKY